MLLIIHGREDLPRQLVRRYTKHLPKWLLALGLSYGFAGVFCVAVAFAPAFVVTLFYGPALLASNFAQQDAERDLKQYALGCDHASQKKHCLTLARDHKPDLRGFLIDSSDTLLAIYLPAQKLVQVFPRGGVELLVSAGVESKAADKTDGKNRNEKDLGRI